MCNMNMRRIVGVSFFLLALVLIVSANDSSNISDQNRTEDDPRFDARVSELLARNMLQLSQEIGTTILQDSDKSSEVFSPLSIYTILSILLMGSNGQSFQELLSLLKINNDSYLSQNTWKVHEEFSLMIDDLNRDIPHPGRRRNPVFWIQKHLQNRDQNQDLDSHQQISVANAIFFQNGYFIRNDFRSAMESVYKSTLQRLDFANKPELSTKYINSWVEEKTQGKIKDILLDPVDRKTKSIMANALYMKALWQKTFLEGATRLKEFYPDGIGRPPIMVEMMAAGGSYPFYDSHEFDCRIIGLPYRKHLTTMYIIMPNNSTRNRLRQFQAAMTGEKIEGMISKMDWKTSIVLFPKLHIKNHVDMKKILKRMGLRSIFNYDQSDLSLISTGFEELPHQQNFSAATNNLAERPLLFNRFAESNNRTIEGRVIDFSKMLNATMREKRSTVTYKTASSDFHTDREPLRLKDLVIKKRITKSYPYKKLLSRNRRESEIIPDPSVTLKRLDLLRTRLGKVHDQNPNLYAGELVHQIDLTVNEVGTEGGAATVTTLRRSGPDVIFRAETPFLFLIRHEETKIPIFYGAVFEPRND